MALKLWNKGSSLDRRCTIDSSNPVEAAFGLLREIGSVLVGRDVSVRWWTRAWKVFLFRSGANPVDGGVPSLYSIKHQFRTGTDLENPTV
jgi:hypothetical protein